MRSAEEMRDYLVGQLDKALHRTDAFGGETAFWFLFNHLAALEEREAEWAAQRKRFPAGAPDGVAGAMAKALPSVTFGPTQFRYGKTFAYVGAESMVAFHFRGGDPEPVLLAVREGVDRFTFTPAGRRPG